MEWLSKLPSPFSTPTKATHSTPSPASATAGDSVMAVAAIAFEDNAIAATTAAAVAAPAAPAAAGGTMSSPSLHVAPEKFFDLIQDGGVSWTHKKPNKFWVPEKSPHKIGYPKIYECGDLIFRKLQDSPSLFPKLQKGNSTRNRKIIMKFIFEMRTPYAKAEINATAFPSISEFVSKLPEQDLDDIYVLDQMALLARISTVYGGVNLDELQKPTANDRIRLFGIALSEDFLEDLRLLVDRKKRKRHEIDSPEFSSDAVFARFQMAFNNDEITIQHPNEWAPAVVKYSDWSDIDPNDENRINVLRTPAQMKLIF